MIDPQEVPRFSGIPTFMRLRHEYDLEEVDADVAFLGVPYDDATTFRPGARFGPREIRLASTLLKPYNPVTDVNLGEYEIVDHDDAPVIPGYTESTFEEIEDRVSYVLDNDVKPAMAGGDHSVSLPIIRAVAEKHGPLSLVQFDAHSDLWTEFFGKPYNHGTWVHVGLEEGLIDPDTSIRIGDRGGLYSRDDVTTYEESGIEYYTIEEVTALGIETLKDRIRDRVDGSVYVSLDIDSVDPGFAPGTGTPMAGGLYSRELIDLVRALLDVDMVGFDLVEVSPPYDDASNSTAILAANLIRELLGALVTDP